jgi:hypothetical protein
MGGMSLHGNPIHENAHLPNGGEVQVFVGMLEDPYIADENMDTVVLELRVGGNVVASVETVLSGDQVSEATELARQVAAGLRSGELEPHASAIEPLADELR